MMDISNSTLGGLRVTDSRGGQLSL
jgi:hypothetical protein